MPEREKACEIEDAATTWAAMAERGLTASEKVEFDRWIEGDSRRLGAYVRAQAAWIHAERAAALGHMPKGQLETITEPQPAGTGYRHSLSRRTVIGSSGALAASIAAAYVIGVTRYRTLESGVGEIRHIALEGGSTLTLDTDTRVDVGLSSNDRNLELKRGKLFLEVAKADTPITVQVGNLLLETAQGAFSLENLVKLPIVALVTEGRLIVSQSRNMFAGHRTVSVHQGQALSLVSNNELAESAVRNVDNPRKAELLAWREGMLSFGGDLLGDAVRAFDRYGSTRIIVTDPDLARQKIAGLFNASDPRGFAVSAAASFGGVVSSSGNAIKISAKRG